MKYYKIRKICNPHSIITDVIKVLCAIFSVVMLTACDNNSSLGTFSAGIEEKVQEIDRELEINMKFNSKNIEKQSIEIAHVYEDLYLQADKTKKSEYYPYDTELLQEDIDKIENLLASNGYPVINSDSKYPDYLENSDDFYTFWENVSAQKDAEQNIIYVSSSGGLYVVSFQYSNGIKYRIGITVKWDENNKPTVSSAECGEVIDWDLINDINFYYQVYPSGISYDDYSLIRLRQFDKELYDLNEKYILPIGYLTNNMFVSDWDYENYGNLSFNDLLEPMYKIRNSDFFDDDAYEKIRKPYLHSYIPSDVFESTIMPYFDISLQDFRERCLYDADKEAYPWQEVCCENITTYPRLESEVIKYQNNDNGTITLTVNARCNNYKTPCLFTHEVIIQPINDSEYHYLSNKIIYKSDYEMPPLYPRLPQQRGSEYAS